MDLDRLRYFCVIAEAGSLRRAAEILRISPPALSKAIRVLEQESGHQLVIPSGRGIAITDQGKTFAARARGILREVQSLRGAALSGAGAARPLRVGSFEVFTTYFLGPLLKNHLGEATPVILHELVAGHLERALIERDVDLGVTYVPVPSAEIEHTAVSTLEMGIFARKGAFGGLEFKDLPFAVPVTPLSGNPDRIRGLDGWPDDAIGRNVRFQVTLMESALELCRQGMAAAYLPRFVAKLHNERVREEYRLVRLEPPLRSRRGMRALLKSSRQPVYLLRRKADTEGGAFRKIAQALRVITSG